MRIVVVLGKLLGSLVIAFVGYFIMAAVGWPEPLESMVMERRIVGWAFIVLGALCAVAALTGGRGKPRPAAAMLFDEEPASPTPDASPRLVAVPAPDPTPEPFVEPPPAPAAPVVEAVAEPTPAPAVPEGATAHPASVAAVRADLVQADQALADGRHDEAHERYAAALAGARQLHAAAPGDDTQDLVALALTGAGDAHDKAARHDPATTAYEEALELRMARMQAAPDDAERKRAVCQMLERLGDVRDARGHVARAQDLYRQSLPLAQSVADSDPDNPTYQQALQTTRTRLGELEAKAPPAV